MADWKQWLEGVSGGALGINKGLTIAADPFLAWDKVQAADQAIDRTGIQNRDLEQTQSARENPDLNYYGNLATSADATHRNSTAKSTSDIYGLEQNLALKKYLADPNDAYQQGIAEAGWTPDSPEYRAWTAEAMGLFDPQAAIKANDTFNIPGLKQQNLGEQATLSYLSNYVKQYDPGAQVVRKPDGTVAIIGSNGTETEVPSDMLVKVDSMLRNKNGPEGAISAGLKDEIAIQKTNIEMYKQVAVAMKNGRIDPKMGFLALDSQRKAIDTKIRKMKNDGDAIAKDPLMDPEEKKAKLADIAARGKRAEDELDFLSKLLTQLQAIGVMPGQNPGTNGPMGPPSYLAPQGNSSVNTRPPIGDIVGRALGQPSGRSPDVGGSRFAPPQGGGGVPLGVPMSGNQAVPRMFDGMTADDVFGAPSRPIGGNAVNGDPLMSALQQLGLFGNASGATDWIDVGNY